MRSPTLVALTLTGRKITSNLRVPSGWVFGLSKNSSNPAGPRRLPVAAQYWGEAFRTTALPSKPILVISGFAESSENSASHVRDASSGHLTVKLSAVAATVTTPARTPERSAGIVAATTHMGTRKIWNLITFSASEPSSALAHHTLRMLFRQCFGTLAVSVGWRRS